MTALPPDPRADDYARTGVWGRVTLDALFKRNLARGPDRLALADSADRPSWTDGAPRRFTYREADAFISSAAARLVELGLRPGAVVVVQLPNVSEAPLTLLACLRAGLVPAVLPILWRTRETVGALEALAPKAIVTLTRMGDEAPADLMRYAAADLFSVRFVLAYGDELPDGVLGLDSPPPRELRHGGVAPDGGASPAMVTFRTSSNGHAPVFRSHNHWVAAGLASVLEARMEPGETVLSACQGASFAGLATGFVPWLLTGGTLVLHQAFDAAAFAEAAKAHGPARLVLPGPLLDDVLPLLGPALDNVAGVIAQHSDARTAMRRAPASRDLPITDVIAFDEWGLRVLRRSDGVPAPLPLNEGRSADGAPVLLETRLAHGGRLALRGPMTPHDPDAEDGFRIIGLAACESEGALALGDRADGVLMVGGLCVGAQEIEHTLAEASEVEAVRVISVPDSLFGERVEAHVATRPGVAADDELVDRLAGFLVDRGFALHKVPSRIVFDAAVRDDPRAFTAARAA
jgi:non-ribosomal peptide synthetase component E (peptide arylation enzyme)